MILPRPALRYFFAFRSRVLRFLWQNLPGTLSYSVPVSTLVSSLLVFSRLSSDSEISAMRSCGVPLASIMRTPVLLAALLALVCLHVNDNVSPDAAYTRALRRKAFKAKDVMALLEPRTWISMGDYDVFVARRDGEELLDLRVNQPLPGGRTREIRAASAFVATNGDGRAFLNMRDVTIDPWRDDEPGMSHAETWQLPLAALAGYDDRPGEREPARRAKDMPTWELVRDVAVARVYPPVRPADLDRLAGLEARVAEAREDLARPDRAAVAAVSNEVAAAPAAPAAEALEARVRHAEARLWRARAELAPAFRAEKELSRKKVEIGVRATLAVACFCFVLVGVPLGIQSHRRESSVGIGLSLAIAGAFYLFCITAESLSKHPELHAHWLLPVPVVVCLAMHVWLMHRHE